MASLLDLPGVTTTTAHFGAFGAETADGQPIKKAIQIMSNFPGLNRDFGKRLSATDLLYCTPVQGNLSATTQVCPDAFVDQLLTSIKGWIAQHEPQRFGYFTAYALSRPTVDAAAWDNVFKQVEKSFVGSNRRPYIVDPDSTFGKEIQDLFRMDAVRIQVANTPTQRRFHSDIPHLARGAALQHIDGSRLVEVEQLDEVRQPKGRFSKPVQFAVFIYGSSRQADELQQSTQEDPGPEVPIGGLPTDVTFPGCDKIPISVRRSVARLHVNLGHPSAQELNRLLCHRGVPSAGVQECVRKLSCATCKRLAGPQQPRPSSTPSLQAGQFGDLVQGEFFWVRLLSGASVQVLGLADTATGYHQAAILRNKSAREAYNLLLHSVWLRPYGLPVRLLLDPDPLFQGEFEELLSTVNVNCEYCPAEAHWVIGTVERRNCVLRAVLEKLIRQVQHSFFLLAFCKILVQEAARFRGPRYPKTLTRHTVGETLQSRGPSTSVLPDRKAGGRAGA